MKKENFSFSNFLVVALLVVLGVLFRTNWHLAPNVEFVTAASLLAGSYLGKKEALLVPVLIMAISDFFLGNTLIFLFTWSAYLVIGLMGFRARRKEEKSFGKKIFQGAVLGSLATFWFYLWTNFGVWLLDSWGMYPKTFTGLLLAYFYGLPFLKNQFLANLFFVPVAFFLAESWLKVKAKFFSFWQKVSRRIAYG